MTTLWIGLEKIGSNYEWHDGSSLGFTKFPTNLQPTKPCVYMYSNTWYDYDCVAGKFRVICKTPKSKSLIDRNQFII